MILHRQVPRQAALLYSLILEGAVRALVIVHAEDGHRITNLRLPQPLAKLLIHNLRLIPDHLPQRLIQLLRHQLRLVTDHNRGLAGLRLSVQLPSRKLLRLTEPGASELSEPLLLEALLPQDGGSQTNDELKLGFNI